MKILTDNKFLCDWIVHARRSVFDYKWLVDIPACLDYELEEDYAKEFRDSRYTLRQELEDKLNEQITCGGYCEVYIRKYYDGEWEGYILLPPDHQSIISSFTFEDLLSQLNTILKNYDYPS